MAEAPCSTKAATEALIAKFEVSKLLKQGKPARTKPRDQAAHHSQTNMAGESLCWEQLTANRAS
jgi:hypothetical protein